MPSVPHRCVDSAQWRGQVGSEWGLWGPQRLPGWRGVEVDPGGLEGPLEKVGVGTSAGGEGAEAWGLDSGLPDLSAAPRGGSRELCLSADPPPATGVGRPDRRHSDFETALLCPTSLPVLQAQRVAGAGLCWGHKLWELHLRGGSRSGTGFINAVLQLSSQLGDRVNQFWPGGPVLGARPQRATPKTWPDPPGGYSWGPSRGAGQPALSGTSCSGLDRGQEKARARPSPPRWLTPCSGHCCDPHPLRPRGPGRVPRRPGAESLLGRSGEPLPSVSLYFSCVHGDSGEVRTGRCRRSPKLDARGPGWALVTWPVCCQPSCGRRGPEACGREGGCLGDGHGLI
ncbi:uncharacterized protein LOC128778664 isoform X1 [Panthera pardus]|uniref:Uncharacterized protein LOC128778664 isoform X1 n=1 Tax=Panthera pardus TaxID=9691 RepID=A0A9W2W1K6_PANPR|nr:uncharacterized protein LOC128778664 isoform X1 [Panthera pardus]